MEKTASDELSAIQSELARLQARITSLESELADTPDYGLGEGDPAIVRWEMNKALLDQTRDRVAGLEQALARIAKGTYGNCERCGNPIHPDRLAVLPGVTTCIDCARRK